MINDKNFLNGNKILIGRIEPTLSIEVETLSFLKGEIIIATIKNVVDFFQAV